MVLAPMPRTVGLCYLVFLTFKSWEDKENYVNLQSPTYARQCLQSAKLLIRPPTLDEIPRMVALGEKFWKLTNYADKVPYVHEDVITSCEQMRGQGLLLGAYDGDQIAGFIGGIVGTSYTNFNIKIGQELFWWIEPQYRNSGVGSLLLQAVELKAKELGLAYWTMIYLVNIEPEKTKHLYERSGYKQTEIGYTKEL